MRSPPARGTCSDRPASRRISSHSILINMSEDTRHDLMGGSSPEVRVFDTAESAVEAAVLEIAGEVRRLAADRGRAIVVFDGDGELRDLYAGLSKVADLPWIRVIGLQLSEIQGVSEDSPSSRRSLLIEALVAGVPMAEFHGLRGDAANPDAVCANYESLLDSRPPDIAVLGVTSYSRLAGRARRVEILRDRQPGEISLTLPAIQACKRLFIFGDGRLPDSIDHPSATVFSTSKQT